MTVATATLKLDLACGPYKADGFLGVDREALEGVDAVWDLRETPWPWADESVSEVRCSHFFEHLTGEERIRFMDELYRVLTPGGKAVITTPYYTSVRASQDPTHKWPGISEQSFLYFNRKWREQAGVGHYLGSCDFECSVKLLVNPTWQMQNPGMDVNVAVKSFWNVVDDISATLTKGK